MARRSEAWRDYAARLRGALLGRLLQDTPAPVEERWEEQPLKLEPWQRRMLGEALAYDLRGHPVWRSVPMIAPCKNGKTALPSSTIKTGGWSASSSRVPTTRSVPSVRNGSS